MNTNNFIDRKAGRRQIARLLAVGLLFGAIAVQAASKDGPLAFATPEELIQATATAAEHNDTATLRLLFGPAGKDLVESGDPAEDKESRAEFARAAHEKIQIDPDSRTPDRVTFLIGDQTWPFPVPVVRKNGKWQFDSATGGVEVLARRIGRNEMNAMEICRGYAEAQLQYSAAPHDGDPLLKYASRVVSSPGKEDGLYADGSSGSLVTQAFVHASAEKSGAVKPEPYHGYFFRVLKSQGPDAPGGAFDYVVGGKMIGGFALVAWPAEYGVSGIRTLIISNDGIVYEKDLGPGTHLRALQMRQFNPDKSWDPVILE